MKKDRTWVFITISSLALAALLVLQVSWLLKSARMKEELFNEKANMVLARTTQELCADQETCMRMGSCCLDDADSACTIKLPQGEVKKIDSLLKHFMSFYNLQINYSFEVIQPGVSPAIPESSGWSRNVFMKTLEEAAHVKGLELKLTLPEKRKFIMEEMGPVFISSVLLILVVFILFIRTVLSLLREKRISEFTTDFLNNMTHEFKTPLTNIGLAGKGLLKNSNVKDDERSRHYTEVILSENDKLKMQVEQVLGMTALERGEIPLNKSTIDLHVLIQDALKCISVQVEARHGELHMRLGAEQHVLEADRAHLLNVICNLVDNAIKYSPGKLAINIETFNAGKDIVLKVSDQGIGLERDQQKKIFEKYYRVPTGDVHDVKGFGLGLSYVKKVVELHKGSVAVESEKGKGSTFIITLPLANE